MLTGMVREHRVKSPLRISFRLKAVPLIFPAQHWRGKRVGIIPLKLRRTQSLDQRICQTAYTFSTTVQYVRVDHGRSDVSVSQEFLNRPDVGGVFREMCRDSRMGSFSFLLFVIGWVYPT